MSAIKAFSDLPTELSRWGQTIESSPEKISFWGAFNADIQRDKEGLATARALQAKDFKELNNMIKPVLFDALRVLESEQDTLPEKLEKIKPTMQDNPFN
jgi:hypothetical protein